MSEQKYERLSAIIDGEQEISDGLIDEIKNDKALLRQWQRYHTIRDGLTNHLPPHGATDISAGVMEALDAEPTILAPTRRHTTRKILKQAAGLAVAASVATVAIMSVQTAQVARQETGTSIARIEQPRLDNQAISQVKMRNQAIQSKLNGYLVNHNEYSVTARMQGMMPYMRIVGEADNQRNRNDK